MSSPIILGEHSFVTKLAGFEHTKYIQANATRIPPGVPMVQGKNIRNGRVVYDFDWYISEEISVILSRSVLDKRCIVVPYVGSKLGELAIFENDFKCHLASNVAKIELLDDVIDLKFLYYYLRSPYGQSQLFRDKQGSAQPNITMGAIRETSVVNFEKNTQRKIAAVLSVLDDKIELNRRINAELEQMAHTLYDYRFVQFDFPGASGKPYKSSGGPMKHSPELNRQIPEGWAVQDMYANDLSEIIKPKIDKFVGTKQYIATADVNDLSMADGTPIIYEGRESRANMQPREYTVWFAKMKESIKHIFVGDYSEDLLRDAIFSTGFMGMKTRREAFEYLMLTIHRPYFELVKDANSNGATMATIGNNDMKNIKLVVPSDEVLQEFHQRIRPILAKIDRNRQQSQTLSHLRDWLLPMLMNGQASVQGNEVGNIKKI